MDKTESVCQKYAVKDQRILYVRQSENRGPAENFQFVLNESVGEYFMWAADDDCWPADALGLLIEKLETEQALDLIYGVHQQVDADNRRRYSSTNIAINYQSCGQINLAKYLITHYGRGEVNCLYGFLRYKEYAKKFWNHVLNAEMQRKKFPNQWNLIGSDQYAFIRLIT